MNYRHVFHAGNAADVFKHVVLTRVLLALREKPKGFFVLDTHAGLGLYALKPGGEHENGIGVLWRERERWPSLRDYFSVIERQNPGGQLKRYPGSPLFIAALLRAQDRAAMVEMHPEDYVGLKALVAGNRTLGIHHGNGWQLLNAFTPPPESRGLVLIDPPYEQGDDFDQALAAFERGRHVWHSGRYLFWYPVKSRKALRPFLRSLARLNPDALVVHFMTLPDDVQDRLNGSGLVLVNPPWQLSAWLREHLPVLANRLAGPLGRPNVVIALAADMAGATGA